MNSAVYLYNTIIIAHSLPKSKKNFTFYCRATIVCTDT